jgi:hypothetical protein
MGIQILMIVPDRLTDLQLENCCEKSGKIFSGAESFLTRFLRSDCQPE